MSKKTWIWPLSWYFRMRGLEAENAALRLAYKGLETKYKDLESTFRAQAIANTAQAVGYVSALSSMAEESQRRYSELAERLKHNRR